MERIEVSKPQIDVEASLVNLTAALESGQIAQGRQVAAAEEELRQNLDAEHAAMVSNGTAALKAAVIASICRVRGINPSYVDRELPKFNVIVPAFSFNATLNSVLQIGAMAKVVDIRKSDYCIDPDAMLDAVDEDTVAVMPVDLYGQAVDTTSVESILKERNIALVRDAAQAHGAQIGGEHIVKHADAICLSFYPTKNISAPEGGAVLSNDEKIDQIVRMYRNQGMSQRYVYGMSGDNLRMTDIHASILRPNIGKIAIFANRRAENAALLSEGLSQVEGITIPAIDKNRRHVWHQYTIMVEPQFGLDRDQLHDELDKAGIGSGVYYPKSMVDHDTFRNHPKISVGPIGVTEEVAQKVLSLPVHPGLTEGDIHRIVETISKIQKGEKS
jgi:dTDP-4-amino-4,6-dideoxygalactose transaminase